MMRTTLWILTLLLVALMCTQAGLHLGGKITEVAAPPGSGDGAPQTVEKRTGGVHVTPGDALLLVTFLLWAGYVVATFKLFEIRLPALPVFALVGLVLASALCSPDRAAGLREAAQLGAYFIGGWLVFANCIDTRRRLKTAVDLFTVVVALVVVVALWQYRGAADEGAFGVKGTFGNRNVLGAFLAVSLPFVFGLALYEPRAWQRFAMMLTVAIGAMVTLSGGALLALAVALLFVAAVHSWKALAGVVVAAVLGLTVVPQALVLPHHTDVVINSVAPYLRSNYLDLKASREGAPGYLVVATRYKRWHAALRMMEGSERWGLLGVGPGRYSQAVGGWYGDVSKPAGRTDVLANFNVKADEPDSFNMYLVTGAEAGPLALMGLVWTGLLMLGRNLRLRASSRDDIGRAMALGAVGAVVGAAACAVFSNILVRGVAMPFIFVALSGMLWARLPGPAGSEKTG
jgi:hypothetical protein